MSLVLKKSAFITLQLCSGIGLGLLGSIYIAPLFDAFVNATSPPETYCATGLLPGHFFFTQLAFYVFMIIGIAIAGYFHFRSFGRLDEFQSAIGWSFMGFLLFTFLGGILQSIAFTFLPHNESLHMVSLVLPIFGGVVGFNFPVME